MKNLFKFFKDNKKIIDIENFDSSLLNVFSNEVLQDIKNSKKGWEDKLPNKISELIKEKKLFGFKE
jgi:hypothetical protein